MKYAVLIMVIMLLTGCAALTDPQVQKQCIQTVCILIQALSK